MTGAEIRKIQHKVGTLVDGIWGSESTDACQAYLKGLMPNPHPWPKPDHKSLREFYGDPWDNSPIVSINAPEWMRLYGTDRKVRKIQCHVEVAHSLLRALEAAYEVAPEYACRYFGCHVDRNTRGGVTPSQHAYGAAIDLAAHTNRNMMKWPEQADMPFAIMEAFALEGWMAAGAFWGRDAMHFAAVKTE